MRHKNEAEPGVQGCPRLSFEDLPQHSIFFLECSEPRLAHMARAKHGTASRPQQAGKFLQALLLTHGWGEVLAAVPEAMAATAGPGFGEDDQSDPRSAARAAEVGLVVCRIGLGADKRQQGLSLA